MSNDRESEWCEVQLEQWRWANMPESAGLLAGAPSEGVAEARLRAEEELGLVLHALVVSVLTTQQRQVMELYFMDGLKQVEVAHVLGISQATVSQHLAGKKRGSVHVGGAPRKLRKAIHKAAKRRRIAETKTVQIIRIMDKLLDRSITRRCVKRLMDELECINDTAATNKKY